MITYEEVGAIINYVEAVAMRERLSRKGLAEPMETTEHYGRLFQSKARMRELMDLARNKDGTK